MKWKTIFAGLAIVLITGATSANFVVNGAFDVPVPSNGTGGGWTSSNIGGTGGWHEFDNDQFFNLNEGGNVAIDPYIEQTLTGLTPGETYEVTGDYMSYFISGVTSVKTFGIEIDDTLIFEAATPNPNYNCPWPNFCSVQFTKFYETFVATSDTHVLRISGERNSQDIDYAIDNISVNAADCSNGGPLTADPHTLLLLHFDGDYLGVNGEIPLTTGGTFEPGRYGLGFDGGPFLSGTPDDWLVYAAAGNYDIAEGTIEFWINPKWYGNDSGIHDIFTAYNSETLIASHRIIKDGARNLKNAAGSCAPYNPAFTNVSDWVPGEWHHVVATWKHFGQETELFIDGIQRGFSDLCSETQEIPNTLTFTIYPYDAPGWGPDAVIDEFRISDVARCVTDIVDPAPVNVCVGFEPPMSNYPVTVKKSRALPLKAEILDADGIALTDIDLSAAPVVQVWFVSGEGGDAVDVTDDVLSVGQGDEGNQFVFTEDAKWQFNLSTKNYTSPGTYTVLMETGDSSEYEFEPTCMTEFVIK